MPPTITSVLQDRLRDAMNSADREGLAQLTLQTSEFAALIPKEVNLLGLATAKGIKPTFDPQTGKMGIEAPECTLGLTKGELRASFTPSVKNGLLVLKVDSATVGGKDYRKAVDTAMIFKSPADPINELLDAQGLKLVAVSVQKDGVQLTVQRK